MKHILRILIHIFLILILAAGVLYALSVSLDKSEEHQCFTLQERAQQYPSFYLTHLEKEMCDFHGIKVNAPVL